GKTFVRKEVFYSKNQVSFNRDIELEDMINFELVDENNTSYGRLEDIDNFGAGNILFVKNGEKEIILPQNKGFIKSYDLKNQQIIVDSKLIKEVLE
ncbi:MAG: PRC-barrel domain-containing protein, partial [Clostridia bacterium]|nr:PRC-barrel domain-containing protein [Clostridia bacterium]